MKTGNMKTMHVNMFFPLTVIRVVIPSFRNEVRKWGSKSSDLTATSQREHAD